jgi:hypothetical protein
MKILTRRLSLTVPTATIQNDLSAAGGEAMRSTGDGLDFDRRNSHRFPIHVETTLETATQEFHATTTDISAGGILFHTEGAIQVLLGGVHD